MSMRDSAIQSWMLAFSPIGWPNVTRDCARVHMHFQSPLGHPDGPHAVVDAARAQPGLADRKPFALAL